MYYRCNLNWKMDFFFAISWGLKGEVQFDFHRSTVYGHEKGITDMIFLIGSPFKDGGGGLNKDY